MADVFSSINGFLGGLELSFANPMGLLMNVIISTIVSGVVILIIVMIFAKKFAEEANPLHAFAVSLIITLVNILGVMPILGGLVSVLPFAGILTMVLPVLVWVVVLKVLFTDLSILHVLIISVICYLLSIYLIPSLVVLVTGYIPF